MAHRSEDLEERVDTGSTMAVTEGDLFCDKQMTPNKNLRAANPKKRGEPEKSSKSKRSGAGAMTLKVEDPPLVLTTLNEEWANKMQNISEMLNSKKEGGGGKSRPKNKSKIRAAQDEKPEAALRCEGNVKTTIVPHEGPYMECQKDR